MPQVAISADFLTAYANIPRGKQKGVRAFIEKFKQNPTASSINYEPIRDMRDDKVRTVRIGLDYRGIVIHPPQGDVYVLVWVDHHDEAMAWAKNKVFEVNKYTGTFQVWEAQDGGTLPQPVEVPRENVVPEERLLSGHNDETLLLLGVPEPLLAAVRALRTEGDLDELSRYLPQEATDALYLLAAGYSVEETIDELDRLTAADKAEPPAEVDTQDFSAALERPASKNQFKIVSDDHELAEILSAPLAKWRVFLHPSQQKLVTLKSTGPMRVLGGAGTGKTVVAMHRARYLAKEVFKEPGQKVLFTTFTTNLAADIAAQLRELCGAEYERIEVTHLHGWAAAFLKARGVKVKGFSEEAKKQLWAEVTATAADDAVPQAFYESEWEYVVQPQGILTEADYLHARRAGRGTRLSRAQRKKVWQVLDAYRKALQSRGLLEYQDLVREARLVIEQKPGTLPYAAVVADEVQDFSEGDLRLLRAIAPDGPDSLFLVGDAHQRIYGHQTSLGRVGISVRGRRSRRLKLNYRTTQRIRAWATALLEGMPVDDLDEAPDTLKGYHSLRTGTAPVLHHAATPNEEADFIQKTIQDWLQNYHPNHICLVARTNALLQDRYRVILENAGHTPRTIKTEESGLPDGIRLATMHRVKGLEFPCVLIAGVHEDTMPLTSSIDFDEASRRAHEDSEKRLLFVAATRARDELAVTGFGRRCRWL